MSAPASPAARSSSTARLLGAGGVAVVAAGFLAAHDLVNTSIGWHLASGRWMMAQAQVLRADPFSFTAEGVRWVDHEWGFQLVVALLEGWAGAPGLVLLRVVVAAVLVLVMLQVGRRHGLSPEAAALLALVCLWGARPRLFVRPELATLVLLPLGVAAFCRIRSPIRRLAALAAVTAVGANLHAGILVLPPILGVLAVGRAWDARATGPRRNGTQLATDLGTIAVATAAASLNPFGWRIYQVPLEISHLVGLPWIPNPEWISPSPAQAPVLWLALAGTVLGLLLGRETAAIRWLLAAVIAALALRHVRNVGVFFVLLPEVVAPVAGRWWRTRPARPMDPSVRLAWPPRRLAATAVLGATALMAAAAGSTGWPPLGLGWARAWYPDRAVTALERLGIAAGPLYNDVRFGGYLLWWRYPPHQVFLDDRNEIHEPLLREIWEIFQRSDPRAFDQLLGRWRIDTALVRYHEPIEVFTPDGEPLGARGFSALWFPAERWALVWFDDVAMILVRRRSRSPDWLAEHELTSFRPDDLDELGQRLGRDPELAARVRAEATRMLDAGDSADRARFVLGLTETAGRSP